MGTRQMVPDPSTIQSTIRAVRCPKLPAPRFLVAAVAGSSYRQADGVTLDWDSGHQSHHPDDNLGEHTIGTMPAKNGHLPVTATRLGLTNCCLSCRLCHTDAADHGHDAFKSRPSTTS
jgi:hypothetical protein